MMTKKDFIALADELRPVLDGVIATHETGKKTVYIEDRIINALCRFLAAQNPQFKEDRWRAYLAGEVGQNGGEVRK